MEGEMRKAIGRNPKVPLSAAVVANGFVFVSGQVPRDERGRVPEGIEAQTRLVMQNMKGALEQAGSSLERVVKTTVFLKQVADFADMNRVYATFFPNDPPARSTIRAELMLDALVEIEAIALAGDS
jgi:2-iminobutanoate/2-iminopropanoate deaminase